MDGEHRVTLAIYSGVPDPVWTIDPRRHRNFSEIKRHLQTARTEGKSYRHDHMPSIVGYKGLLVHPPKEKDAEWVVGHETKELQKLLVETMPKGLIPDNLYQTILEAIESKSAPLRTKSVSHKQALKEAPITSHKGDGKIQHYAPKLNLDLWNSTPTVQSRNNCYNYANDKITNSFAQPGTGSGLPYDRFHLTRKEILAASERDGLVKLDVAPEDPCPKAPEQPNCLVALFVAEGVDFHWYRLGNNGRWSHKPGLSPATIYDGDGKLIDDPRNAANSAHGPNYEFVSFMKIFTNIIK